MLGFLSGVLYANFCTKDIMCWDSLFQESTLQRFVRKEFVLEGYMRYVLLARGREVLMLALVLCVKWRMIILAWIVGMLGFGCGMVMVAAITQLGGRGILICFAAVFPQGIFYILAYSVLFVWLFQSNEKKWNRVKSIFVIVMFGIGIITEIYINPLILKGAIQLL